MPRMEKERLLQRLANGKPVGALLLLGNDAYLRETLRARLVEAFVPEGAREWAVSRFSVADAGLLRVLQQCETRPMLAPHQVVIATDVDTLEQLDEARREQTAASLESYLKDPADFTTLILEAEQLDQRMRLFKVMESKALVVSVGLSENPAERDAAATRVAQELARELGVQIEGDALDDLTDLLDGDLTRLRTEMDKLTAYVGERKRITPADVDALVVSEKKYSIWQLADLLANRQRARALEFLGGVLREGEEPAGIVGALAWMYRTLIQAQELPRHATVWDLMKRVRMRKDTAELALAAARRIPRAQLLDGLEALYEADSVLKSGPANARAVMEFLVARLTGNAAKSMPA